MNNAIRSASTVCWCMTYKNLTSDKLAQHRTTKELAADGTWPDWPHPTTPTKKKRRNHQSRTARGKIAKAFKPGFGRYS
ncbi:hypothetical protein HME9302_02111 [Alteripontixanthobacter maritimus]|nr:hypothetical protein HME9302_02111 [Alteripontixanthobacter maritimus]